MSEMNEQTYSPLVSIVVPMYNQRRHLDDCLKSIVGQTYKNIEVIVVNDGSTDDSPLMAKQWAGKDERIKVIDKPNAGAILARLDGYRQIPFQFYRRTQEFCMSEQPPAESEKRQD